MASRSARPSNAALRSLRGSIRTLDVWAPIDDGACDTITSYGAETLKEPTT